MTERQRRTDVDGRCRSGAGARTSDSVRSISELFSSVRFSDDRFSSSPSSLNTLTSSSLPRSSPPPPPPPPAALLLTCGIALGLHFVSRAGRQLLAHDTHSNNNNAIAKQKKRNKKTTGTATTNSRTRGLGAQGAAAEPGLRAPARMGCRERAAGLCRGGALGACPPIVCGAGTFCTARFVCCSVGSLSLFVQFTVCNCSFAAHVRLRRPAGPRPAVGVRPCVGL